MIRRPPRSTLSSSSAASDVYKRQLFEKGAADLQLIKQKLQEKTNFLPEELADQLWRINVWCKGHKLKSVEQIDELYEEEQEKQLEYAMRQNCVPGAMDGRSFALERQIYFSQHGQAYDYEHPGTYSPYKDPAEVAQKKEEKKDKAERAWIEIWE
eukprot:TRINITY_DN4223_c0_g1_i2.p1 TRINITY_DN4223_c0_g1~~TRINITY_DN4223_c0_g1_i2.p1  ORF type:complete len:155 (-),score=63.86 TRINITY_DN4223_c0_g1_i2:110-574(-)